MELTPLTALSPLDGRYAGKVAALRPLFSEFGLIKHRVIVEIEWFKALAASPKFKRCRPFLLALSPTWMRWPPISMKLMRKR